MLLRKAQCCLHSAEQLSKFCCFRCHFFPCPGHSLLVQVQVLSPLAAALKTLAEPAPQHFKAGRQAGRGADYDAAAMTFNGDGAQHWVGADYVRHHSYTAASFIHMTIEHGCGLWPKKNTFQLAPCRDPNTSTHCASPLSSSSYTSSFFSKSPGLRGSTWMCT